MLNERPKYSITLRTLINFTLVSPFSILTNVGLEIDSASDTSINESLMPVRLAVIALANCADENRSDKSGILVGLTAFPAFVCLDDVVI